MKYLANHPSYWLDDAAADALNAYEAQYGVLDITDAGRTVQEQQDLIDRWYQGGTYNRPPYLYQPYMPAASGPHVGGHAVDTTDYNRFAQHCGDFGWQHNLPNSDPVHFIYVGGGSSGGGKVGNITSRPTSDVQQALVNAGIGIGSSGVDGIYGKDTTAAVAEFQKQKGLDIDGVYGPATDAALFPAAPPAPPTGGGGWAGIQQMLKALYGYTGAIDNDPGQGTWAAMQRFLKANWGYTGPVDGDPGENTYKAMQRWLAARYGYTGDIDGIVGDGTNAALDRAGAANDAAF
jgi:peptidoglycan hydrolase-like protein with peptidoglycan-binding domain